MDGTTIKILNIKGEVDGNPVKCCVHRCGVTTHEPLALQFIQHSCIHIITYTSANINTIRFTFDLVINGHQTHG